MLYIGTATTLSLGHFSCLGFDKGLAGLNVLHVSLFKIFPFAVPAGWTTCFGTFCTYVYWPNR